MPTMVEIDGNSVDMEDPCAIVLALQAAELKIATGGGVVMTQFNEHNEVRWSAANVAKLSELIAVWERRCATKNGQRTRYAKRMRFVS